MNKMDEAYVRDMEALQAGSIVDNRLKMMKEVETTLYNTDLLKLYISLFHLNK